MSLPTRRHRYVHPISVDPDAVGLPAAVHETKFAGVRI